MARKPATVQSVRFSASLTFIQQATIGVTALFVVLIGGLAWKSPGVSLVTFGLFCQLVGTILLSLGLVKTNDEMLALARHHEDFDKQRLITHLVKDRFFIVAGAFLMAVGIFSQIAGAQFAV